MRVLKAIPTCTAAAILMLVSGCASPAGPPAAGDRAPAVLAAAAGSASPIPGTDPAIQRWFLDNDAAKVAFNDALLRAERGVAGHTASECTPLRSAVDRLNKVLPKLAALSPAGQKLAAAMQPAVTTFDSAATACLAKNFAAAQTALDSAVLQQADAQARVDEILDGDL
jgi:t-SNARE complex subunit (syntaxin)